MTNRNIEVGCLAVVISSPHHPESVGDVVQVVSMCTEGGYLSGGDVFHTDERLWEVESSKDTGVIMERCLMRIDNYDASTDTVTTEQEQTA